MMNASEIEGLTERLTDWQARLPWSAESSAVIAAAVTELAAGEPVVVARVGERGGLPAGDVLAFLRASPAEFDEAGRLVGLGLTLRPTPHRIELDGRTLYTWCALDTLMLPVLLGKPARIESRCFATGEIVRFDVDPGGVRELVPDDAIVSLVPLDCGVSDFRCNVCDEQHFFSSPAAATDWRAERPDAIVVPVRSGFALTRVLVAGWFRSTSVDAGGDVFDRVVAEIPSCALDEAGRGEQKARYAALAPSLVRVLREREAVVVEFDHSLDRRSLEHALAAERECCPFLRFVFDQQHRRLRVTVTEAGMLPALDAIARGFGAMQHVVA
jgi:alkylmercury lyase